MKYRIIISLFFGMISSTLWAAEPIRIGVAAPFSGDLASYGFPVKNAVILAVNELNRQGGINGRKIEILAENDSCDPDLALQAAARLIAQSVVGVIGHLCSHATEAALPLYKKAQVVVISPASTNPGLTLEGKHPNFFRTIAHDAVQAILQVSFAQNHLPQVRTAALLHDQTTYGHGLIQYVKRHLAQTSIKVVVDQSLTPGLNDYSSVIAQLGEAKPDVVFFGGFYPEASTLLKQLQNKEIPVYFISGDGGKDPSILNMAPTMANRFFVSAPIDAFQYPMTQKVLKAHKDTFHSDMGTFTLQAYSATLALINALQKAEPADSYANLIKVLQTDRLETPLGSIGFDKNGDLIGTGFTMYQVKDDRFMVAQ